MASRYPNPSTAGATRNRGPSRPTKVNDENAAPLYGNSTLNAFGGTAGPLRGKPSVKELGGGPGVGGKKVLGNSVEGNSDVIPGPGKGDGVKAGMKRAALGSVSSNGFKDPHVDTDIPLKATRLTAKSRSPSGSIPTDSIDNVVKGGATNPSGKLTTSVSASITGRPTAPLPRHGASRSIASTSELLAHSREALSIKEEDEQHSRPMTSSNSYEIGSDHADGSKINMSKIRSDSGLTPSLGDLGVAGHGHDAFEASSHMNEIIESGTAFAGDHMASRVHNDIAEADLEGEEVEEEEEEEEEEDDEDWLRLSLKQETQVEETLMRVRDNFVDEVDMFDTTMVAEYADDIFHYMSELEEAAMPNPLYMEHQTEIEWGMRATLIDWLLQVHLRYHMLPETLWIAVNLVDRFLSQRVVSLVKLQLVGVTAMFVAAKYEEILAPSVDEFVYMTENGYTKDEILKGEKIILQTLDFEISSYCSPYSWVRKISKADDYDIQTRTLSKFLMEVTLLDHRFLRAKPSMIAAIGMYLARLMLDGDWNEAFVYYSNYTDVQLHPGAQILCEQLCAEDFDKQYVSKKYSNKKFLRASTFARDWALAHDISGEGSAPSSIKEEEDNE